MLSLNDREWKVLSIFDLFEEVQSTKGVDTGKLIAGDDVPYIAAAKDNNGYKGMFSSGEYPGWVSKGNGVVVVQLGDGAAGLAWYVPMDFIGMKGKTSVCYNKYLNNYNGVFIARVMSMNKERFSHGYSWTGNRLLSTKVCLPVSMDGQPDYDFMENCVKEQEQHKIAAYINYCNKQLQELGSLVRIDEIDDKDWEEFFIDDLFFICSGKRLESYNMLEGRRPFIGATDSGNGITNYISNENDSLDRNVLGVNYNGSS